MSGIMANSIVLSIMLVGNLQGTEPAAKATGQVDLKSKEDDATANKDKPIVFPTQVPNSRIELDKELVGEVNTVETKFEQIKFLLAILPLTNAKSKHLTERQVNAILLLGLTKSKDVIAPLIERLEFSHKKWGEPAVHALAYLAEPSVEPLVAALQKAKTNEQISACLRSLREIKRDKVEDFGNELLNRKDVKMSKSARELLRIFVDLDEET